MNRRVLLLQLLLFATSAALTAQNQTAPKFEVASVKPAGPKHDGPSVYRGGPGTADPERITFERIGLLSMILYAYSPPGNYNGLRSLDFDQVSGPPWLNTELFFVDAKVPAGTTKEQLMLMWQGLLAERFHLKLHFTTKEFTVYELTVAKNGPKLKKAGEAPQKLEPGFRLPPPGAKFASSFGPPRNARLTFRDASVTDLIGQLRWPLSEQGAQAYANTFTLGKVVDKTGLDGSYDFTFEYAGLPNAGGSHPPPLPDDQTDTAPFLAEALKAQLGLQLEEKKAKLDMLVIDHVDRIPTEN
jgi:uncharacterized protein (TIGR03435 family)